MASSRYTLLVQAVDNGDFEDVEFSRTNKGTVIAEAEKRRAKDKVGVRVVTDKGTTVLELKKPKKRVVTFHTPPFTKLITVPEGLTVVLPNGYEPAYCRPRNGTVVARATSPEIAEDERYVVVAEGEAEPLGFTATTRAAGALMKGRKRSTVNA